MGRAFWQFASGIFIGLCAMNAQSYAAEIVCLRQVGDVRTTLSEEALRESFRKASLPVTAHPGTPAYMA